MSTISALDEQIDNHAGAFGYCQHLHFAGSLDFGPPEFCDQPADETGLCAAHNEPDGDPDLTYDLNRDERC